MAAEPDQRHHLGEPEGLDSVPVSAGGVALHMPVTAELSLLGTGNYTCPPPREEVLSRPLLEAGGLRETCRQDTNTFSVAVLALLWLSG